MAREKIVVVTLDEDVTVLPTHPAFDKVEREGERALAISYNKDRMNAGEVRAAVNALGHGIVDVSTREADLAVGHGRASCREGVGPDVEIWVVAGSLQKK